MELRKIITPAEVGQYARPCYADDDILVPLILEAMREDLRPKIGDALFIELTDPTKTEAELSDDLRFLLNGGSWQDCGGRPRFLAGVKTALAYYVYARVIRDGNIQSTRYGARTKNDENSFNAEDAERQRQYRQAFGSADTYAAEVLAYINDRRQDYGIGCPRVMKSNRTKFRVIGAEPQRQERKASPVIVQGYEFMTSAEIAALFNK